MRQSLTAVLERDTVFDRDFATEPYEVAWASEARWFVHALVAEGDRAELRLVTQISPDGINWCDYDGVAHPVTGTGVVSWPVREFGHWLRLRGTVHGQGARFTARIYLATKS